MIFIITIIRNIAKKAGVYVATVSHVINKTRFVSGELQEKVKDVVVEVVGCPEVVDVGLRMLRRGGTYCETGNFVDTGSVELNIHRLFAAKNVLFIGNTNHPHDMYYAHFEMMIRNRNNFPWEKIITHRFTLNQCKEALKKAYESDALKVVFIP